LAGHIKNRTEAEHKLKYIKERLKNKAIRESEGKAGESRGKPQKQTKANTSTELKKKKPRQIRWHYNKKGEQEK